MRSALRLVPLRAGSVLVAVGAVVAGALSVGCGLRSDALFTVDTDVAPDTDPSTSGFATDEPPTGDDTALPPPEEGRMGSCTNAIPLPTTDTQVQGYLEGPGLYTGICGDADGLEDVYVLRPTAAADVTITFDDANTDFSPIVRVQENGCPSNEGVLRTCTDDWFDEGGADPRHFLVFGNREYYIHVDSDNGDAGDYAFDVTFAPPPLAECEPHPNVIFQEPGSLFRWENEMPGGQGHVDSQCGGIGRENFFQLEMFQPGPVNVTAFGSGGFRPVVGVRTDCSARTEVDCTSELLNATPGVASLDVFLEAGTYFIDVDDLDLIEGAYVLEVAF